MIPNNGKIRVCPSCNGLLYWNQYFYSYECSECRYYERYIRGTVIRIEDKGQRRELLQVYKELSDKVGSLLPIRATSRKFKIRRN